MGDNLTEETFQHHPLWVSSEHPDDNPDREFPNTWPPEGNPLYAPDTFDWYISQDRTGDNLIKGSNDLTTWVPLARYSNILAGGPFIVSSIWFWRNQLTDTNFWTARVAVGVSTDAGQNGWYYNASNDKWYVRTFLSGNVRVDRSDDVDPFSWTNKYSASGTASGSVDVKKDNIGFTSSSGRLHFQHDQASSNQLVYTDDESTWTIVNGRASLIDWFILLSENSSSNDLVFISGTGTTQITTIISTDDGATWADQTDTGLVVGTWIDGAKFPGTDNLLLAHGSDIFRSTDDGANWSSVYTATGTLIGVFADDGTNSYILEDRSGSLYYVQGSSSGSSWAATDTGESTSTGRQTYLFRRP